jgi:hypothetical protein
MRVSDDLGILHEPPDYRNYIKYLAKHVAWTRYRGWFPVSRLRREAFVAAPWEVNSGLNDAELACGMSNGYCIVAKFNHDIETPAKAFELLGNEEGSSCMIPGCLYLALDLDGVTQRYSSIFAFFLTANSQNLTSLSLFQTFRDGKDSEKSKGSCILVMLFFFWFFFLVDEFILSGEDIERGVVETRGWGGGSFGGLLNAGVTKNDDTQGWIKCNVVHWNRIGTPGLKGLLSLTDRSLQLSNFSVS